MFSLLCGMYTILTEKPEHKILMVGLEESGKTVSAVQERFCFVVTNFITKDFSGASEKGL